MCDISMFTPLRPQVGTHDELASMDILPVPLPGCSGAPVVAVDTGAVVGLVRGSRLGHSDRRRLGFATPTEALLELFGASIPCLAC